MYVGEGMGFSGSAGASLDSSTIASGFLPMFEWPDSFACEPEVLEPDDCDLFDRVDLSEPAVEGRTPLLLELALCSISRSGSALAPDSFRAASSLILVLSDGCLLSSDFGEPCCTVF